MAVNWNNIIGGWSSAAQEGRNRAKNAINTELKILEANNKASQIEQANAEAADQVLQLSINEAEELSRHYRPEDLEKMRVVAANAEDTIKEQLKFYGDDITAFMKGGGMNHLRQYRDAVLMSEEAQTIRSNHANIAKYLDLTKNKPHLVSNIDREGFEKWKTGEHNAFVFHGNLQQYEQPSPEELQGQPSYAHALFSGKNAQKNLDTALYNYNIDTNQNLTYSEINTDQLINYVNQTQQPSATPVDFQQQVSGHMNNSKKASDQLLIVGDNINRGFTGDWNSFWEDDLNKNALYNLNQRTGLTTFAQQGEQQVYAGNMFVGQESEVISSLFDMQKKDYNGKINRDNINALIQRGTVKAYDTDGNALSQGEQFNWSYGDDLDVMGIQYGFKVTTDHDTGKKKLLTYDDVSAEGDGSELYKNKSKDGTVIITMRDKDRGVSLGGKDDFVYLEIDINNPYMAQKLDKAVGEMEYRSKAVAETSPGQYVYNPGEKFSFTGDRPKQAITTLHNGLQTSLKSVGITTFDPLVYSTVMAHSLSMTQDEVAPQEFIQALTTSQDPIMKEALNELKEGDVSGYINVFKNNNKMSKKEANKLQRDLLAIIDGYQTLSNLYEE
jgi:hypothetical protein